MKRTLYILSLWAMAIWTVGCIAWTGWSWTEVQPMIDGIADADIQDAARAGATWGLALHAIVWSLGLTPLGIIALLCREPRYHAPQERREPTI